MLRAVATVILGPAAATASALGQADAAPMHHPVRADRAHAYIASEARAAAGPPDQPLKRSHSRG